MTVTCSRYGEIHFNTRFNVSLLFIGRHLFPGKLRQADFPIYRTVGKELAMAALSGQMSVIQHQNSVCRLYGSHSLRYQKNCLSLRIFPKFPAQGRIGGKIKSRGTVVQDQNRRVCRQRSGDGQSLSLVRRKNFFRREPPPCPALPVFP